MQCRRHQQLLLVIFIILNCLARTIATINTTTSTTTSTTARKDTTPSSTTALPISTSSSSSTLPPFTTPSHNITILHEVSERQDDLEEQHQKPLILNTHEVLPAKPLKKKPYNLLDKAIIADYEKPRPLKEYDLHPVTFDFNLGDLEDLADEVVKKAELTKPDKGELKYAANVPSSEEDETVDIIGVDDDYHVIEQETDGKSNIAPETVFIPNIPNISLPPVVTISPHIFKVLKSKSSKKGRELLKHDEAPKNHNSQTQNSISRYFGGNNEANSTAQRLTMEDNVFQLITNLYDHFYWEIGEIRHKVSTACGLEVQAYLTGLHENLEWAQKAYDASGRYRGQILFGNDKWLGQKIFCHELNRQLSPEERKHFEFEFYAAVILLQVWVPQKLDINLQLGECLPKLCTAQDVQAILSLDPHARALLSLSQPEGSEANTASEIGSGNNSTKASTTSNAVIQVRRVRKVPGMLSYWRELKFQIFVSFIAIVLLLVITATWYQAHLNRRQLTQQIPAISAKIDAHLSTANNSAGGTSKHNELYQMQTLHENNNVVEIESEFNNINKNATAQINGNGNTSTTTSATTITTATTSRKQETLPELEKSQMAASDYKVETASSAGATGHYEAKKQLGLHEQLLLCFAFQTNTGTIMSLNGNKEYQTACIHGLRVLSILWTIFVHTYLQVFNLGENRFRRKIVERSIWYQFIGNATFSVDTFFFISGFLVTLLYMRQGKKYQQDTGQFLRRGGIDTLVLWIYRYVRLTPAYLFVIFFDDFSLRHSVNNSVLQPTVPPNTCNQFWWRNILYINNFYPLSEICMIWSWYMANDMQFYIMATLLLLLSSRYFKTAVLTVLSFLLSSWAISGVVSLQYRYTHKVANPFESFDFLYDKPWQRVGTYIIGMITGYIMFKVKQPPKIASNINRLLWMCSLGLLTLVIFGVWNGELSVINTAFYVSMGHTAFGVSLVWIVLSCCWGLSPTVNRVLSYRGLLPLSRLTYCTYLIHPLIMLITSFNMDGPIHLNQTFVLIIFLGNAVLSFIAAFFISVLFEAPVIRLLKICFRK